MVIEFFYKNLEDFLLSLDANTLAKVLHKIELLEYFGNMLRFPHSKNIKDDIFELRINGKVDVRII